MARIPAETPAEKQKVQSLLRHVDKNFYFRILQRRRDHLHIFPFLGEDGTPFQDPFIYLNVSIPKHKK